MGGKVWRHNSLRLLQYESIIWLCAVLCPWAISNIYIVGPFKLCCAPPTPLSLSVFPLGVFSSGRVHLLVCPVGRPSVLLCRISGCCQCCQRERAVTGVAVGDHSSQVGRDQVSVLPWEYCTPWYWYPDTEGQRWTPPDVLWSGEPADHCSGGVEMQWGGVMMLASTTWQNLA